MTIAAATIDRDYYRKLVNLAIKKKLCNVMCFKLDPKILHYDINTKYIYFVFDFCFQTFVKI